jgi:hypothetical protein
VVVEAKELLTVNDFCFRVCITKYVGNILVHKVVKIF